MRYKVGDRIRIRWGWVRGVVTSVNPYGYLGVAWDDGSITPDGMLHPVDVDRIADDDGREKRLAA